jgi:hypothetical protein
VYFSKDLMKKLEEEFEADPAMSQTAVEAFVQDLMNSKYEPSAILTSNGDVSIEGDIEVDAEFVYDTQRYWDLPEAPVDAVGLVDVELPDDYEEGQ